uniref:NADH-ubiquinone oxidoreductase chain 5 n=1 Tax=Gynaikothrips ficorum TaxID=59752 RepID=A0A7M1LEG7_GYNFI|nr:NADH dehydrogenase subunit 5 [Gynaikothrips ficorum]QOQ85870.1 NADH dehydrogenase subunit 5 [Gynaikothrips ficorum]
MKYINKNNMMMTFFLIFISLSLISFFFFFFLLKYNMMYFFKFEILFINSNMIEMVFYFDWMSFSFLSVVFFISGMVSLYSMEYMNMKKNYFIILIFLFVFSMMLLILSTNLMSILLGWDGLGLVSYILIIFFQSDKSKNSGMLTLLLNRIGDILIIFSSWILFSIGGMNFFYYNNISNKIIIFIIILASMTKSAQIPFSSWLPAAMAAPTPVSSLVHSSTLVTAGIYLMIRFNNYFFLNHLFMKFILIFSSLTMFMSGLAANYEMDLKKIIALSTLSQLGLMMMILSLNFFMLSFFHLLTHALFKALLFLCSGIMLHNLKNNQDIRYMGMMIKLMPMTIMCFNVANLSLCGFIFLSGFFSKDLIIENYIMNNKNLFIFLILLLSTSLTVSYTFRLIFFLSFKNMHSFVYMKLKENNIFSIVIFIMTFLSIFMGSLYNWTMFLMFYEPFMSLYMKFIIPFILIFGLNISFFFLKKKNYFFSSLWFLNFCILSLKNVPMYFNNKVFYSSNFGFFEFLGSQGMYKYIMQLSLMNKNYFLTNFKILIFLSLLIFNLMINYL